MRPTTPSISSSGMNAAMSDAVIDMTVKVTSFAPFMAAAWGGVPASMWRTMLSVTTMASSTTRPTERVRASRVMLSSDKPRAYMAAKVVTIETGMVTLGLKVVARRPMPR